MKKIPTLFIREFDENTHKMVRITHDITPGCEEAFIKGLATVKLDGACCAIINGQLYRRYDAKQGKPVPENAIKCQENPDPVTGHFPCWVPCSRRNKADKWFWSAYDSFSNEYAEDGTYEAIGPHFRSNPYGLNHDVLEKHGLRRIGVERTFDTVKQYLSENYIEGIVFWYKGEPVCKIKRSDFGLPWNKGDR